MKLIECPQCGMRLSNEAIACKRCAYPSKKFSAIYYSTVKLCITQRKDLKNICRAYDKDFNILSECSVGGMLKIKCTEPITVLLEIFGCICKSEIVLYPGESYIAELKKIGVISIKKFKA